MKKVIFLSALLAFFALNAQAQITVGSENEPHTDALLDLKQTSTGTSEKGLLMPRVELKSTTDKYPLTTGHVKGMTVYNTATSDTSDPGFDLATYVSPGLYYNDGDKWERVNFGATNWFYMPSVTIDTSTPGTMPPLNLYDLYKAQFDGTSTNFKASVGAPAAVPYIAAPNQLYYYITYYDPAVFKINSISGTGEMSYEVLASASECSIINIVFVLK